jgi:hypothetical protein
VRCVWGATVGIECQGERVRRVGVVVRDYDAPCIPHNGAKDVKVEPTLAA